MLAKEAQARIKINKLLEAAGWRFLEDANGPANVGAAGSMPNINQGIVESIPIPLPPLPTQRAIVAEIEAEQALVNANRELIRRMEATIKAAIDRVWGIDAPVAVQAPRVPHNSSNAAEADQPITPMQPPMICAGSTA